MSRIGGNVGSSTTTVSPNPTSTETNRSSASRQPSSTVIASAGNGQRALSRFSSSTRTGRSMYEVIAMSGCSPASTVSIVGSSSVSGVPVLRSNTDDPAVAGTRQNLPVISDRAARTTVPFRRAVSIRP